ncbi:exported hypothetical protein [Verrucomicrobia bacterium]|nr:exported hypothetical protein [Verrucomicrobiota bacterium]
MNSLAQTLHRSSLRILTGLLLLAGCKPANRAPEPLPAEQIPAVMQRAFAAAKPEAKQLIDQALQSLGSKDYPGAYQALQAVSAAPEVTKAQLLVSARAMLTINELLKSASASGDQSASTFIEYQKHNR